MNVLLHVTYNHTKVETEFWHPSEADWVFPTARITGRGAHTALGPRVGRTNVADTPRGGAIGHNDVTGTIAFDDDCAVVRSAVCIATGNASTRHGHAPSILYC